jgi:hypothetical protein
MAFGVVFILFVFIKTTRDALNDLGTCLYYLVLVAPLLGAILTQLLDDKGVLPDIPYIDYLIFVLAYFVIWGLIVLFGEIKTVKLATLIIAQVCTVIFLVSNIVLYIIPIDKFNKLLSLSVSDLETLNVTYGIDTRKVVELCLEILFYPTLIIALLTYLIAEYREYKKNRKYL